MITVPRHKLLEVIAALCVVHPEMRLGQLVCNLASLVDLSPGAVGMVSDESLHAVAATHLETQLRRLGLTGAPPLLDLGRRELLRALAAFADFASDKPLGQALVAWVAPSASSRSLAEQAGFLWNVEDDQLAELLRSPIACSDSVAIP